MPKEMIRPCTLPEYWKAQEPIEACDIISFGFNWGSDSVLSFESVWKGQTSKDGYPELDLAELEDIQKWIDERYYSSDFENIDAKDKEFLQLKYYRETAHLIAEALNAPVLATEEVLAGLPDEGTVNCTWEDLPKFEVQVSPNENYDEEEEVMWIKPFYAFDEYPMGTIEGWFVYAPYYTEVGDWNMALTSVEGLKIRATNNETAEYLRQFYTDGTPVKNKETD